ncbi:MAG: tetratricopeptide repeat protein, partial [Chloroflexota bacterium]|nr:tetratricopeptide repeat protein [Chloroflexota bacterium]
MLEWIKRFCRVTQEEQPYVKAIESHLSNDDLPTLLHWLTNDATKIDRLFVAAFINVIEKLLSEISIKSTQRLFYLDTMSMHILFGNLLFSNFNLDEFWRDLLAQVVRVLEENAIGSRSSDSKNAADVYKRVYNYRGCCLAERGDYTASIEHFNVSLTLDPHFAPAYCNRTRAYLELNRLEEAWADCETMYSFDDKYPIGQATYQLVKALRRHKASQDGTTAELAEEYGLLELLRRYSRPLKPRETYAARQDNPLEMPELNVANATPEELNHLGVVRACSGDYEGAIEAFNQVLQMKPDYDKAYFNRAQAYVLTGNYKKAIADFLFNIQQSPQDASTKYFLAKAYKKWKREQ